MNNLLLKTRIQKYLMGKILLHWSRLNTRTATNRKKKKTI